MGGKFGHGFATASVTQAASPAIDLIKPGASGMYLRVLVAAVVGGTVSHLTGGKFANGALTGAWSRRFNDEEHLERLKELNDNAIIIIKNKMKQSGKNGVTLITKEEISALLSFISEDVQTGFMDNFGEWHHNVIIDTLENVADSGLIEASFASHSFRVEGYNSNTVYKGSDINYIAVGIYVARLNGTSITNTLEFNRITLATAILGWNAKQASDGVRVNHNIKQGTTTAQYWGGVGYDFYKNYNK